MSTCHLAKRKNASGQTLIGILVALAIFSILSQAIFTVVGLSFNLISFNRARVTARYLAQQQIEFIRNLPYDDVGTVGGIPSGSIAQEETVTQNELTYTVKTSIIYIDDPFDGVSPTDTLATDYKRARVEISWQGLAGSRSNPVVFLTDIAPKGVETTAGGGTLSIIVFDANGNPLSQANVAISAPSASPAVSVNMQSGSNGRVLLPGAPACVSCYQITVTKTGYSTDRTYSTSKVANPNKPDQTVIEGQLTEVSFAIDKVSTLNIASKTSRDDGFNTLPNTSFTIRGDKTIGTDTNAQPVYKYDQVATTDASGNLSLNDIEWDNYHISRDPASSYDISGTNPLQPLSIIPDTTVPMLISFAAHTNNSLLMSIIDNSSVPIASASATIDSGSSQQTIQSGAVSDPDYGQVFFSNLSVQNYSLTATASGYLDYTGNVSVSGTTLEQVIMSP